eukprot:CAMPEP_0176485314 /NCGR_PEP_ID=MMETSP0200_2-20121128/4974_1 /TAXON_ID=947934 /ORGANISM="Chaetoceros sp., Strain GSL56" /LENGTH=379 /DNA_ID=CAMNT_0017881951 /DNA_START=206 /DNA_END=1345 /DNA_ORIENTATION=+
MITTTTTTTTTTGSGAGAGRNLTFVASQGITMNRMMQSSSSFSSSSSCSSSSSSSSSSSLPSTPLALSSSSNNNYKNKFVHFSHDPVTRIGIMTLHSPTTTHNPLTMEMGIEFRKTVQDINTLLLNNELNMNTIILHGANSTFSAGGDIHWLLDLGKNSVHSNSDLMYDFYQSFLCVRKLQVPVICAIDGYAIGAGACLAIATDIRVMSKKAKIGFNFVKLGIHSGMGGSHFLPIAVGEAKAMEILLMGKVLTGEEAERMGLIQVLVDEGEGEGQGQGQGEADGEGVGVGVGEGKSVVLEEAKRVAARIGRMNPLAVRSMVQTMRSREDSMGMGLDHALRREAHAQAICYARNDWGEGLTAVMEKRQPSFDDYQNNDWL